MNIFTFSDDSHISKHELMKLSNLVNDYVGDRCGSFYITSTREGIPDLETLSAKARNQVGATFMDASGVAISTVSWNETTTLCEVKAALVRQIHNMMRYSSPHYPSAGTKTPRHNVLSSLTLVAFDDVSIYALYEQYAANLFLYNYTQRVTALKPVVKKELRRYKCFTELNSRIAILITLASAISICPSILDELQEFDEFISDATDIALLFSNYASIEDREGFSTINDTQLCIMLDACSIILHSCMQ